jgi:hypothetical protein
MMYVRSKAIERADGDGALFIKAALDPPVKEEEVKAEAEATKQAETTAKSFMVSM